MLTESFSAIGSRIVAALDRAGSFVFLKSLGIFSRASIEFRISSSAAHRISTPSPLPKISSSESIFGALDTAEMIDLFLALLVPRMQCRVRARLLLEQLPGPLHADYFFVPFSSLTQKSSTARRITLPFRHHGLHTNISCACGVPREYSCRAFSHPYLFKCLHIQ